MHPQIIDIVKMIRDMGWKPVINSNGMLITRDFVMALKKAGVWGFTFHIDSGQKRAGWNGKDELELNDLRLELATIVKEVGGLSCSFNATVYPETLRYVPELVKWAQDHIDKVQVMVFILYRMANLSNDFDYYVGDERVDFGSMPYSAKDLERRTDIQANEVVDEIRKLYPDFMPSAFLNGTVKADTYKWLLTGRMGNKYQIFGYVGPKFMEIVQTVKHLFTDKYLAYSTPGIQRRGRIYFPLALFDKGMRGIVKNYLESLRSNPFAFYSRVYYQSIMIIQPIDIYENGEANMCDGCPDISVWGDEFVWSCRMEEQYRWGQNVRIVPKK